MLTELFTLGDLYVSDFLATDEAPVTPPSPLRVMMDDVTSEVRLERPVDPHLMYGRYWYRSGTNATMTRELKDVVDSVLRVKQDLAGGVWLDIASNDGTLLSHVPGDMFRVGIDPADQSFVRECRAHADAVIQDFFSAEAYQRVAPAHRSGRRADVVTCIAMFYDLDDPDPFLADVREVLADDGVFVLQMSYSPLMLAQVAFDNICHEHVFYYTLSTLQARLAKAGFRVVDCQLNDVNGGSFRVYATKNEADPTKFGTQPYRDVCRFRVEQTLDHELVEQWNSPSRWRDFFRRIESLKRQTVDFVREAKADGKTVWGYGASTKGNTLLQYFGLDHTMLDGIAERSHYKFGLRTVGTDVPIYSEEQMRVDPPDYLLVLPWHFIAEFVQREHRYLEGGGKFVVPCPEFRVIGA